MYEAEMLSCMPAKLIIQKRCTGRKRKNGRLPVKGRESVLKRLKQYQTELAMQRGKPAIEHKFPEKVGRKKWEGHKLQKYRIKWFSQEESCIRIIVQLSSFLHFSWNLPIEIFRIWIIIFLLAWSNHAVSPWPISLMNGLTTNRIEGTLMKWKDICQ